MITSNDYVKWIGAGRVRITFFLEAYGIRGIEGPAVGLRGSALGINF